MSVDSHQAVDRFRLPEESGPYEPLPDELDTAGRWRARARLVRPEAQPVGRVATENHWVAVFHRQNTVPIETDADLDATSAYPRASREPGVYEYASAPDASGEDPP